MLAISDLSCPLFDKLMRIRRSDINYNFSGPAKYGAPNIMIGHNVEEVCDYYLWAWTTFTPVSYTSQFEYMRTEICPYYYAQINQAMVEIDENNENIVSGAFLQQLVNTINTTYVAPEQDTKRLMNYNVLDNAHLFVFASAVSQSGLADDAVPNSSQLTFETYSDNTIKAYLNDQPLNLIGCTVGKPCSASSFVNALTAKLTSTDWATNCQKVI